MKTNTAQQIEQLEAEMEVEKITHFWKEFMEWIGVALVFVLVLSPFAVWFGWVPKMAIIFILITMAAWYLIYWFIPGAERDLGLSSDDVYFYYDGYYSEPTYMGNQNTGTGSAWAEGWAVGLSVGQNDHRY